LPFVETLYNLHRFHSS